MHLCDTCFDFIQHTEAFIWVNRAWRSEKKALILGEGRHIDFLDIGLSLAWEVLFPFSSDYLCAV